MSSRARQSDTRAERLCRGHGGQGPRDIMALGSPARDFSPRPQDRRPTRDERRPLDAPKATAPPAWGRRGRAVTRARGFNSVACCVRGGRTHHPGQDGCRQGQLLCSVNSKLPPRPHRRAIRAPPGGEAAAARKASTAPASAAPSRPLTYLGSIQVACRAPDRPACAWLRRLQRTTSGNQRERPTTR